VESLQNMSGMTVASWEGGEGQNESNTVGGDAMSRGPGNAHGDQSRLAESEETLGADPDEKGRSALALRPIEPTGEPRVDEAISRVERCDAATVAGHVAVYEGVYETMQAALAGIDGE
jgi:hypothetical protein